DPPIAVVVDVGLGVDPGGALAGDDGVVGRRGGQVADEAGIAGGTVGVAEVGLLSARVDDAGQVPGAVEVQVRLEEETERVVSLDPAQLSGGGRREPAGRVAGGWADPRVGQLQVTVRDAVADLGQVPAAVPGIERVI